MFVAKLKLFILAFLISLLSLGASDAAWPAPYPPPPAAASPALAPPADYYLIDFGGTGAVSTSDDALSGAANCTLRDALEIANANLLPADSPVTGCDISNPSGTPPATPIYVVNLPSGPYTYNLEDPFAGGDGPLDIFNTTLFLIGDTPANSVVRGLGNAPGTSLRVFDIFGATVEMSNFTVQDGAFTAPFLGDGAGMEVSNSDVILDNMVVQNNTGRGRGGGIYASLNTSLTLRNGTLITNNSTATGNITDGGGLYINGGTLTIEDSTISNNTAEGDGGGLYTSATATITSSLIDGNTVTDNNSNGGGIVNRGTLTVNNSILTNNAVTVGINSGGGAIFGGFNSITTLDNGTLLGGAGAGNYAPEGGAVRIWAGAELIVLDATLSHNVAQRDGGAIYSEQGGILTIGDATHSPLLANNEATEFNGAGIYLENSTATITNTTIRDGTNTIIGSGGAVTANAGSVVTITDSTLTGNTVQQSGGALAAFGTGTITATNVIMSGNTAAGGGAVSAQFGGTVVLNNCTVGQSGGPNTANIGGGLYVADADSSITVNGGSIAYNAAILLNGGGAYVDEEATLSLQNVDLNNNSAVFDGGGVYLDRLGTLTIADSTVRENSARNGGGVAFFHRPFSAPGDSTLTISNSDFTDNQASGDGGGLYLLMNAFFEPGTVTANISDSTFANNTATGSGGGVALVMDFRGVGDVNLAGVTIGGGGESTGNTAAQGGGLYIAHDAQSDLDLSITGSSLIQGNTASTGDGGGIYHTDTGGTPTNAAISIDSLRLLENVAANSGGGLFNDAANALPGITVVDSIIESNSAGNGSGGIEHTAGVTDVTNSCIVANGTGFANATTTTRVATGNWWGAVDGPSDADGLSGATGSGDGVTQFVDFSGFLTERPAGCSILDAPGYASDPAIGTTLEMVSVDGAPASTLLTISEVGNEALEVDFVGISGPDAANFSLAASPFPFTIPDGGAPVAVQVVCSPEDVFPLVATLQLSSNDPANLAPSYPLLCVLEESPDAPPIDEDNPPQVIDPAISKIGTLAPGQLGLPGEQITWVVTVSNPNSGSTLSNVVVTDTLRDELRVDEVTSSSGTVSVNGQAVTVLIPQLPFGQAVEVRILTTVLRNPAAEVFSNTASVRADGGGPASATAQLPAVSGLPDTGYPPPED